MNEPDVYPVGTNKFLFVAFGNIPNVSPEPDGVPIGPPVPKLVGNVVTPLYMSRVGPGGVGSPIAQIASDAWNPAPRGWVPLDIKLVVLKLPEPDHTTSGPTCETVTVKSPVAPDVGVGVGVGVLVGVMVGVIVGVLVGVLVGVGVGVIGINVFQKPLFVNQSLASLAEENVCGDPYSFATYSAILIKELSVKSSDLKNPTYAKTPGI
jgi:hypothetical protein